MLYVKQDTSVLEELGRSVDLVTSPLQAALSVTSVLTGLLMEKVECFLIIKK